MGNQQTSLEEVVVQGPSPGANNKSNINRKLPSGQTLLMAEIQLKNLELVKELIKSGADTNITDKNGETAINMAIRSKNLDIIAAILDNQNTNVNKLGRFGLAAVHVAASSKEAQIMELLLNAGADPNMPYHVNNQLACSCQKYPYTPLHIAIDHEEVVKVLLKRGASVNIGNPLLQALLKRSVSVVSHLLAEESLDVRLLNDSSSDVLAAAAAIHHCESVRGLVQRGVHVQRRQAATGAFNKQICAMAYIVHCRCLDCFNLLLPHICDLNAPDLNGYTLLEYTLNSNLWGCNRWPTNPNHQKCLQTSQIGESPIREQVVLSDEWLHYAKRVLLKGADLSVVWNKWSLNQLLSRTYKQERQAVLFCIQAFTSPQNHATQTCFRKLGIHGDLQGMSLFYLDGYNPTEEDLLIIENKIHNLNSIHERENTAFVKGKLHHILEQTRTLKNIAVASIRRSCGPNVYKPVHDLPLPEQMKRLILLEDLMGLFPLTSTSH